MADIFKLMRRDTDRDGVADIFDRDDDNDGITDLKDRTPRGRSSKIVKVRQGFGAETMLSFWKGKLKKKKTAKPAQTVRNAMVASPAAGRSVVASQRGYAPAPGLARGEGRNTGNVNPLAPSSRADLQKIAAPGRAKAFGISLPTAKRGG